ncbi:unnamed protein product [Urochloa humidicola]
MQRSIIGLCRRPSGSRVGSAPPRWWLPALVCRLPTVGRIASAPPRLWPPNLSRGVASLMDSASAHSDRHVDCVSGSSRHKEKQNKPNSIIPLACGTNRHIDTAKMRKKVTIVKKLTNEKKVTNEVTDNNPTAAVYIWFPSIIANSSHRDGAIYKNKLLKENWFDIDITDRHETRLEPMMFSKATEGLYFPRNMLQFFSVTLAECSISNNSIQLYGYIAARDDRDCMLNYVLNHSRDDPINVQKGSLIQMIGPKRGIEMVSPVLIEFDMRIKNGRQEEDDLQLIDGAIKCDERRPWKPIKHRIKGNCGAVDISLACIEDAVEATIEVVISEVHTGFSLSLGSFVYVVEDYEEIQLFHGTIDQSCVLRRFVLAVTWGDLMILKFKFGNNNVERQRSFKAKLHGCSSQRIKHELANILVKVTWSTI